MWYRLKSLPISSQNNSNWYTTRTSQLSVWYCLIYASQAVIRREICSYHYSKHNWWCCAKKDTNFWKVKADAILHGSIQQLQNSNMLPRWHIKNSIKELGSGGLERSGKRWKLCSKSELFSWWLCLEAQHFRSSRVVQKKKKGITKFTFGFDFKIIH